jgi:hypothetical protein
MLVSAAVGVGSDSPALYVKGRELDQLERHAHNYERNWSTKDMNLSAKASRKSAEYLWY